MQNQVAQNRRTVLHCVGGLGRTGVAAALYLKQQNAMTGTEAIARVRKVRSPRAVENSEQENYILEH
jgi:protein-tyrosine phosphatase